MNKITMIVSSVKFEKEFTIIENAVTENKEEIRQNVKHAIKEISSLLEERTIPCNVSFTLESPDFNQAKRIMNTFNLIADCFAFLAKQARNYLIKTDYESILFYNLHQLFIDASCESDNFLDWLFF